MYWTVRRDRPGGSVLVLAVSGVLILDPAIVDQVVE